MSMLSITLRFKDAEKNRMNYEYFAKLIALRDSILRLP